MDDMLLGIVLERLEKSLLTEDATDLLLAAFESEESLSAQLSGEAAARPPADGADVSPSAPTRHSTMAYTVLIRAIPAS
jgi:hypothetical protein